MENRGARLLLEVAIGLVLLGIILLPRWMNPPAAPARAAKRPEPERIVLAVLPRGAASEVLVRDFAKQGLLLANSHALAHPALPNRIALVAGSAWGVHSEATPPLRVRHLGDLLDAKQLAWQVCADEKALLPFAHFAKKPKVRALAECDRSHARFTYIAARSIPAVDLRGTLLIVTIDEGRGQTNDIVTAIAGEGVRAGSTSRAWYDHYSVLRTIEELLHLGTLTAHDAKADVIDDPWR